MIYLADAAAPPPKTIYDPDEFDTRSYDTLDTMATSPGKTPSHMDAVRLRVQLWDSYRLARIILGIPIKSFNLKSKTILNAIRVVAEMKVELIRLNERAKTLELEREMRQPVVDTVAQHQEDKLHSLLERVESKLDSMNEGDALEIRELLQEIQHVSTAKRDTPSPEDSEHKQQTLQEAQQEILQLKKQLKTKQVIHDIELEACKNKHLQQIIDISGQLDTYKEQVERQSEEIHAWQDRYTELENIAVTPDQAQEVLTDITNINEQSSLDEQLNVQNHVVEVLQKMSLCYNKQKHDSAALQATIEAAERKEAKSKEELLDLKMQEQIFEEDAAATSAQDWREAKAAQKAFCKRQINDIMTREENRLLEMEFLELRLTELAFTAVEIEDLENEVKENQRQHSSLVKKVNARGQVSQKNIQKLQKQMEKLLQQQKDSLQDLQKDFTWQGINTKLDNVDQMSGLTNTLQEKHSELCQTKDSLSKSHARIQLLEHQLTLAGQGSPTGKENPQ